jgi:cyanophycinase
MLALVGSGEYLPPMDPVDRVLLGRLPGPPRVVCLPTAAGTEGPKRIDYWARLGEDHFAKLGAPVRSLPVTDRASADDPALAGLIAEANFVYLSGGKPAYLYQTLEGSLAWEAILAVLRKGGLLAGCSAGAMIMGEAFFGFSGQARNQGFRLLPGATVIPHYDELPEWMVAPVRKWISHGLTLVGIEANTALFRRGEEMEVLGSGGVTVWNTAGKTRYVQGVVPDWTTSVRNDAGTADPSSRGGKA